MVHSNWILWCIHWLWGLFYLEKYAPWKGFTPWIDQFSIRYGENNEKKVKVSNYLPNGDAKTNWMKGINFYFLCTTIVEFIDLMFVVRKSSSDFQYIQLYIRQRLLKIENNIWFFIAEQNIIVTDRHHCHSNVNDPNLSMVEMKI